MGSGTNRNQRIIFDTVYNKPVGLDVKFPMANPLAFKRVVAVLMWERLPIEQHEQWGKYLHDIPPSRRESLKFTPESF
jgi:hypothetical protein